MEAFPDAMMVTIVPIATKEAKHVSIHVNIMVETAHLFVGAYGHYSAWSDLSRVKRICDFCL